MNWFFFTTIISYNLSIMKKKKVSHYEPKYLNIFVFSTSIFLFFKSNFNHLKIIEEKNNIIQKIAKFTFGIYLIHPLIIFNMDFQNLTYNQKVIQNF